MNSIAVQIAEAKEKHIRENCTEPTKLVLSEQPYQELKFHTMKLLSHEPGNILGYDHMVIVRLANYQDRIVLVG